MTVEKKISIDSSNTESLKTKKAPRLWLGFFFAFCLLNILKQPKPAMAISLSDITYRRLYADLDANGPKVSNLPKVKKNTSWMNEITVKKSPETFKGYIRFYDSIETVTSDFSEPMHRSNALFLRAINELGETVALGLTKNIARDPRQTHLLQSEREMPTEPSKKSEKSILERFLSYFHSTRGGDLVSCLSRMNERETGAGSDENGKKPIRTLFAVAPNLDVFAKVSMFSGGEQIEDYSQLFVYSESCSSLLSFQIDGHVSRFSVDHHVNGDGSAHFLFMISQADPNKFRRRTVVGDTLYIVRENGDIDGKFVLENKYYSPRLNAVFMKEESLERMKEIAWSDKMKNKKLSKLGNGGVL